MPNFDIWQADSGSLAYAFPSYEDTGPKTDLPAAEQNTIRKANAEALRSSCPAVGRRAVRSQVLIVQACPLRGPLPSVTAWTMTRTLSAEGPAYNPLLAGLLMLALTIFGSAAWLTRVLFSWSRKIALIEDALGKGASDATDLPTLPPTGEQKLDHLVDAFPHRRATCARTPAGDGRRAARNGRAVDYTLKSDVTARRLEVITEKGRRRCFS